MPVFQSFPAFLLHFVLPKIANSSIRVFTAKLPKSQLFAEPLFKYIRPLQFNYLSYKLFLEKKSCQTPKKIEKKVTFGVLRTKVVLKFSVRLQKKKAFKNILCKGDSINYRRLSLL